MKKQEQKSKMTKQNDKALKQACARDGRPSRGAEQAAKQRGPGGEKP